MTDLLLLNFKTPDFVSHRSGPDAPETADAAVATDAALGRLVEALEAKTRGDAVVIVTADHGMPALAAATRRHFAADVVELLNARFDPEARRLVRNYEPSNAQLYLDGERLRALGISLADVARHLESLPFVFAAYTEDEVRRAAKRRPLTRRPRRSSLRDGGWSPPRPPGEARYGLCSLPPVRRHERARGDVLYRVQVAAGRRAGRAAARPEAAGRAAARA